MKYNTRLFCHGYQNYCSSGHLTSLLTLAGKQFLPEMNCIFQFAPFSFASTGKYHQSLFFVCWSQENLLCLVLTHFDATSTAGTAMQPISNASRRSEQAKLLLSVFL